MKKILLCLIGLIFFFSYSQNIGNFTSVTPAAQSQQFVLPSTHTFQKIIEVGDALSVPGTFADTPDFSGYVPISNSSTNGYLSVNHEIAPGVVTVLDVNFNVANKLWVTSASQTIDFSPVFVTGANCSGTVTSWGTVISSEEYPVTWDFNIDGYNDTGWNVEINPATKTVIGKLWSMGNFAHENVSIHSNQRTVYQGADSDPGYLYKFVATTAKNLNNGLLYVYKGSKNGAGNWVLINNTTKADRNNTVTLSANAGAISFAGIEDVEIGPDGYVYFAVKSENQVYRFWDADAINGTTVTMETYVGNMSYNINDGTNITSVVWGYGNDNLAFDGDQNLWVLQDGENNHIWVVRPGHTQANPKVELFGTTPIGSEPTGITFTPDFKYLFMSIQHPDSGNRANEVDAGGNTISFSKGTTLVIALNENLGTALSTESSVFGTGFRLFPNPIKPSERLVIKGNQIQNVKVYSVLGELILDEKFKNTDSVEIHLKKLYSGLYLVKINNLETTKLIIK